MRKLYPRPIQATVENETVLTLPSAAYGMLMRLLDHFWLTGCEPLPKSDDQLFSIARAHRPTWRHWKPVILKAFDDIAPELIAYRRTRLTKATTITMLANRGGGARSAQAAMRRLDAHASTQTQDISAFQQLGYVPQADSRIQRPEPVSKGPDKPKRSDRL